MVYVYYHIYAIDGVDTIIDEQICLIEKHFNFPYILNVGISIANKDKSISFIIEKFHKYNKQNYHIRDIRAMGNEFTTIDLIENDKNKFGESDYILYIHTKGASKLTIPNYNNIKSWRELMNYFNIEKCKNVFKIFEKTDYNTYGVLLNKDFYSGNFWWAKANYLKTISLINKNTTNKDNRYHAEGNYLKLGKNWKPYSPYNINSTNPYLINFKRNEYAK